MKAKNILIAIAVILILYLAIPEIFDPLLRKVGVHDSKGLKHSVKELEAVREEMPFKTLEEQAEYVDVVTKEIVDSGKTEILTPHIRPVPPEDMSVLDETNTTGIGNLAYIALHAPEKEARIAKKTLKNYTVWAGVGKQLKEERNFS